jgi:serine/threonine protein kinase
MFDSVGHYKVLDRIGAGGMGEVFRARDTRLGRTVAIKVVGAQVAGNPERRERFLREARAAATLSHPNIAALYEIGEDREQLFLVFEFVPGENLKTVIGGRPMNPRRAIDIAVQIADALAEAQAEGIVHRDIKPANIIVTPKGNAKILDFGLAAWTTGGAERAHAADAATVMVTAPGTTPGTVAYMSPEQALGEQLDHRTDIFSLGIVMFEMLTGKLPFSGATPTALTLQIVQAPAPVPSSVNRSLPVELDVIVNKALAKSLDQRYESSVTLAADLRSVAAILDVRSDAAPPASLQAAVQQPRRRSAAGWIILLVVLAVLLAAAWFQLA